MPKAKCLPPFSSLLASTPPHSARIILVGLARISVNAPDIVPRTETRLWWRMMIVLLQDSCFFFLRLQFATTVIDIWLYIISLIGYHDCKKLSLFPIVTRGTTRQVTWKKRKVTTRPNYRSHVRPLCPPHLSFLTSGPTSNTCRNTFLFFASEKSVIASNKTATT